MNVWATTHAALARYFSLKGERQAIWDKVETNADLKACIKLDATHLEEVHRAFFQDTKDFNTLANVRLTTAAEVARMTKWDGTVLA